MTLRRPQHSHPHTQAQAEGNRQQQQHLHGVGAQFDGAEANAIGMSLALDALPGNPLAISSPLRAVLGRTDDVSNARISLLESDIVAGLSSGSRK
ncbi:hypothetical protein F4781DRAFT_405959 [Annulohypoxylon bovei var. microspora]|nr:hypothetical protein F4781DRAFT_405959 [Annulohypoxylon bovei var. microspora]